MWTWKRMGLAACGWMIAMETICCAGSFAATVPAAARQMPQVIERFAADRMSLNRIYPLTIAPARMARFQKFYDDELAMLAAMNFDKLSEDDQIDYLLLKNRLTADLDQVASQKKQVEEMQSLLPFGGSIDECLDRKREMKRPDAEKDAAALTEMVKQMEATRKKLDPKPHGQQGEAGEKPKVNPVIANRAAIATMQLSAALKDWFGQYNGYDPVFTWWVDQPYKDADKALTSYNAFLKEKLIGIAPDDKTTIIGDPVGRDALMSALADDMIPYTPEELIAIAQIEYDWCMREMLKASHEMGLGDDWHAAVEKVKQTHVPPGEQPEVIRKLVLEGSDFVEKNNLVRVPPLPDDTWYMIMMTPQRQLVNPFFTGGNELSVSYPTDTMTYEQREMSMRGNSTPLSHATAFHEMIPGHFLQFYMGNRYDPYRRTFSTSFWHEGNAFWWEMLLWDKGYNKTPEERVGG